MQFSFQLYSARNYPPISGRFSELKSLGYTSVEGFGGLYDQVEELALALTDSGMSMPTGHFGLEQLQERDKTLEIAQKLGVKTLICPFVPPQQRAADKKGWQDLAATLSELCAFYRAKGYAFAWHNHDFEFLPLATGELPMDLLLEGAPDMLWQADIAWVHKSGEDPFDWITQHAKRITSVHVKDIAPQGECEDEDGWADLGEGVMDWASLFKAIRAQTTCSSFVMEHDNPSDLTRFARRSIAAANRLWE